VSTAFADDADNQPGGEESGFHFTDKRKVNPDTGEIREGAAEDDLAAAVNEAMAGVADLAEEADELTAVKAEAAEHLDSLQRERASFINYRNKTNERIDTAKIQGVEQLLRAIMPALDDIDRVRAAGELPEGTPFAAIADKFDQALASAGIEKIGAVVGDIFDPAQHDALMHRETADHDGPQAVDFVIASGYRIGDRVVRAAQVGVVGSE
jgi:molecular chaperone GrpE